MRLARLQFPDMLLIAYIILHGPVATTIDRLIAVTTDVNCIPMFGALRTVFLTPNVRLLRRLSAPMHHEQLRKYRVLQTSVCGMASVKAILSRIHAMHGACFTGKVAVMGAINVS